MNPRIHESAKPLFDHARSLSEPERSTWLRGACGADGELRSYVQELLDALEGVKRHSWARFLAVDGSPAPSRHLLTEGQLVGGRFRIAGFLGSGGMGEVYEAEDEFLTGQRIALKTLRPELAADSRLVQRFEREVRLALRVTHPNVCRVYHFDSHRNPDGAEIHFLTMELIEGETLAEHLESNAPLSLDDALALARHIAEALKAAHESGIVHRDLKPGNVLVTSGSGSEQRCVVTDFGIACAIQDTGSGDAATRSLVVGSPAYMAPELLCGGEVTPATDIYSFGAVLYELVAGVRPYSKIATQQLLVRKLTAPPESPRRYRSDLTPQWEETILECLQLDPAMRPQTAGEVITRIESRQSIRRASPPPPAPKSSPRRRAVWLGVAALMLVSLSAAAFFVSPPLPASLCGFGWAWPYFCPLPADRDVVVLPFENRVVGDRGRALADGLLTYSLDSFKKLAPDKERHCIHLRDDHSAPSTGLVLTGVVETASGGVRVLANLRESGRIVRTLDASIAYNDLEALQFGLTAQFGRLLGTPPPPAAWTAWRERATANRGAFQSFLRGLGYLKVKEFEAAAAEFDATTSENRDFSFVAAHVAQGDAYRLGFDLTSEDRWAKSARNAYRAALGLDNQHPEVFFGLGQLAFSLGQYEQARADFEQVLKLDAYHFDAQRALSRTFQILGRTDLAEQQNREIIATRPECWYGYNHAAIYYFRQGRYEEAEDHYLQLLSISPDNATGYHNLSELYRFTGRYPDAIRRAKSAVLRETHAMNYVTLGLAYLGQGCVESATVSLERAAALDPADYRVLSHLGEHYQRLGRYDESTRLYDAAAQHVQALIRGRFNRFNDRALPLRYLAIIRSRQGDLAGAEQAIHDLEEIEGGAALTLYCRAVLAANAGDRPASEQYTVQALQAGLSTFEIQQSLELSGLLDAETFRQKLETAGVALENHSGFTSHFREGDPCALPQTPETQAGKVAEVLFH